MDFSTYHMHHIMLPVSWSFSHACMTRIEPAYVEEIGGDHIRHIHADTETEEIY